MGESAVRQIPSEMCCHLMISKPNTAHASNHDQISKPNKKMWLIDN
jgi:hypothetical protein